MWYDEDGLQIAFDIGLTQEATNFKEGVNFKFIIYKHDPRWKLRSAAKIYYDLYPELFLRRTKRHGNWSVGFRMSEEDKTDAGVAYSMCQTTFLNQENYDYAKEHNIHFFKHREPWAWWHLVYPMSGKRPHPYKPQPPLDEELKIIEEDKSAPADILDGNDQIPGPLNEVCKAAENSFLYGEDGKPIRILWHDWEQGWHSQIPLNLDPKLPTPNRNQLARKYQFPNMDLWGKEEMANPGVSWDSLTRWTGFHIENFRKEHFHYMEVPPAFHYRTGKVVQIKGFHDWEAAKAWSQEATEKRKSTMANTDSMMYMYCGQFLDCMGVEKSPDEVDLKEMALDRTLSYQKPISFWRSFSEDGLNKSLFYAIGPGNQRALWEERGENGRKLTRKYMELIDTLGQAGWEPVTYAWVDTISYTMMFTTPRDDHQKPFMVERYGNGDQLYFTVHRIKPTQNSEESYLYVDIKSIGLDINKTYSVKEIISGEQLPALIADGVLEVKINPTLKTVVYKVQSI